MVNSIDSQFIVSVGGAAVAVLVGVVTRVDVLPRFAGTVVIAAVFLFSWVLPHLPVGNGHSPSHLETGVLVAGVGTYGVLVDPATGIYWLFVVGGIAMALDAWWRDRTRERTDAG